jgi:hypothetical protein
VSVRGFLPYKQTGMAAGKHLSPFTQDISVSMAESMRSPFRCTGYIPPRVTEEEARNIVREWLSSDLLPILPENMVRFGKAVMVYMPFWRYIREDGGETKILYRPACGTFLTGVQDVSRPNVTVEDIPNDIDVIPAVIGSSVYLPELHGIARSEQLIAVPLWLISYKAGRSIHMVEVDGVSGEVYPEWHPIKEPVNWRRTALIAFVPMFVLSAAAVYLNTWIFVLVLLLLAVFLYQSEMLGIINLRQQEEQNGP